MESKLNNLIKIYGNYSNEIENSANELEEMYYSQPSPQTYNTVYQACIDSLGKLLKHTESLCVETTLLLDTQNESIQDLADDISGLLLEVNINRELGCRRLVGERTVIRQKQISKNVVLPTTQCVITKVINTSLDITRYDGIGHGATHSSRVPATKTSSITLKVPNKVNDVVFRGVNNVECAPNCISYFWLDDNDRTMSDNNIPNIQISSTGRKMAGNKTNKKTSTLDKPITLSKGKQNTFRRRNSLTIKASAPNDVSDDIYTNILSISSCHTATNATNSDETLDHFADDFKSIAVPTNQTNDNMLSELEPSKFSSHKVDSVNDINYNNTTAAAADSTTPFKFPTPKLSSNMNVGSKDSLDSESKRLNAPAVSRRSVTKHPFLYKARVLYDYEKSLNDELTITEGDIIEIVKEDDDGWFVARLGSNVGSIPGNYIEKIED